LFPRKALEPAAKRHFGAVFPDPDGLAGLEVADEGDELMLEVVPAAEPLLVDADVTEWRWRSRRLPTFDGALLGATDGKPAQSVQRRDVNDGHRRGLHREVVLQPSALPVVRVGPRDHLYGVGPARPALHAAGGVLDLHRVPCPRQIGP